jgi:hypothetical protein
MLHPFHWKALSSSNGAADPADLRLEVGHREAVVARRLGQTNFVGAEGQKVKALDRFVDADGTGTPASPFEPTPPIRDGTVATGFVISTGYIDYSP